MAFKYKVVEGKNKATGLSQFFGMGDNVDVVRSIDLCTEISHSTTVTEADVEAVLSELEYRIIAHLQNNESVRFGKLGSFCPRMASNAATSAGLFLPENIKGIRARFTPSASLKYALNAKNPEVKFRRIDE